MIKNINLIFLYLFIAIISSISSAKSDNKVKIELQIGNEILTNIDFLNEENYLIALNNNLKNLPKNQLKKMWTDERMK